MGSRVDGNPRVILRGYSEVGVKKNLKNYGGYEGVYLRNLNEIFMKSLSLLCPSLYLYAIFKMRME